MFQNNKLTIVATRDKCVTLRFAYLVLWALFVKMLISVSCYGRDIGKQLPKISTERFVVVAKLCLLFKLDEYDIWKVFHNVGLRTERGAPYC